MMYSYRTDESTYCHEIGHNLGLSHAGAGSNEYGDTRFVLFSYFKK